jgi:hypothetical protein
MSDPNTPVYVDQPYIKLTKNSKGFTWDIKIMGLDVAALKAKNDEMEAQFGNTLIVGASKYGDE